MFDPSTRILVVDDMMTMRKIVTKCVRTMGFTNIKEANDGALAWDAVVNAKPSLELIISDWNMPNCSGIDLLKRVRADQRFATLPFILVTAEAEQKQVIEALKLGVSGYVVKPFTHELLRAQLEAVHAKMKKAS